MTHTMPPLYPVVLSDGLVLRPLREENAQQFFALVTDNRAHFERYDPWFTEFQQVEDVRRALAKIQNFFEHGNSLTCGIWDNERLVGYFICGELHTKAAKTGYGLAAEYLGRGIIARTGRIVLDYAFSTMGIESAWLNVWTNNEQSIHTAERLGFKREPEILPATPEDGNRMTQYRYILKNPHRI